MIKEEIIKLAIEHTISGLKFDEDGLLRFAKLVAEKEREECAKMCDYVYDNIVTDEHIKDMAFKIRARGQE